MIGIAEISLTTAEIDAATEVLKSGQLRQGKQCAAFEEEFAAHVGAKYAVTSANGSSALHLYYMAESFEPGDEVIVPTFTFIATASMPAYHGLKPVFCDADPETFLLDLNHAESLVTERTRAISPVHLFGNICDIEAIEAFARKHDLKILWDAAQAHGGQYKGKDIGSFGDAVAYSFYPSKNMFVGEGGMTCTNDESLAELLKLKRSHGASGKYLHTELALNYRMTDVEAAIGREQLKRLDSMLEIRRRNGGMLNEGLGDIPGVTTQKHTPDTEHAYHQYCILVDEAAFGCSRDALSDELNKRGIGNGVHYPRGLHQQPIFQQMYGEQTLPVAERLAEEILAIPVHHGLSESEVEQVITAIREIQSSAVSKAA